jgi:coenzyme Q-binding protein COQ10
MLHHKEKKLLPYTPYQLFDLVADVDAYPQFLPWCLGSKVYSRTESALKADVTIGFSLFREKFTSNVTLNRPESIHVVYENGPLQHLSCDWLFEFHPNGTQIDFSISFDFHSRLLQGLVARFFDEAAHKMICAFEARAHALYSPQSQNLWPNIKS